QSGKVLFGGYAFVRRGVYIRQIQVPRKPIHKHAGDAAVEVGERMDAQQAALGECQGFKQQLAWFSTKVSDACGKVTGVVAHMLCDEMRCGRLVAADHYLDIAPTTSKVRGKVTADALMKPQEQIFVNFAIIELTLANRSEEHT